MQARQTLGETRALLAMARRHDFILGVVGWVPLVDSGVAGILERFAEEPRLKACRHVLQDEPDDDYMLGAAFNRGIRAVTAAGLVYDILIFERHLPQTIRFVDRHPEQDFVLDHIGKPRIRDGSFSDWNRRIRDLARRPRIRCKMSGLATEAAWGGWTEEQFLPYLDAVLEAFGPDRLMFGSDWPVSLPAVGTGAGSRSSGGMFPRLRPASGAAFSPERPSKPTGWIRPVPGPAREARAAVLEWELLQAPRGIQALQQPEPPH